ncbi:MAG: anthranilate phosphoribosyltransferase [Candidatus Auribacterota bacterium]|jgi:anthranilate phosphoribosyltransferase|nr:anthranilate phosphoribosyltransferase [Candidatus Auribacterota bacterium]
MDEQPRSLFPQLKKLDTMTNLTSQDVIEAYNAMVSGEIDASQAAALLTLLHVKGETSEEIYGFARAMLDHAVIINPKTEEPCMDTVGTGGDRMNTINISTATMFVLAGAGIPIAKHGNRGITSKSGSADVLTALGIKIDYPPQSVQKCIEKCNIGYMFAPLYHPSMKHIMPVRKNLPFRTVFNVLGPLTNPARASRLILGVCRPELVRPMAEVVLKLGAKRALVYCGYVRQADSYMDEISPFGKTACAEITDNGSIEEYEIAPDDFKLSAFALKDIQGDTAEYNSVRILDVLQGKNTGPMCEMICMNAAAGLYIGGKSPDVVSGFDLARDIVASGKAYTVLENWRAFKE